ncbi:MAG TPA: hypothetical protein VFR81_10330 [Longimicrobium sp.]|nr:hypothetical protein [Longimicrobium sp.]
MSAADLLRRIISALERVRIPYMLTGSFASSFYGAPRATQDVDLVISGTPEQIGSLVESLPPPEYYVDRTAALDAQRTEGQFNVLDLETGWKIDLIVRKSRAFSREEFDRRVEVVLHGVPLMMATAEDVVIAKLEWAKMGESQRQIDDAANILRIRRDRLDEEYLLRWVRELGLDEQWEAARKSAGFAD